jgi:hypothetical protein
MTAHLVIDMATAPLVIGVWLWLAWANGKGRHYRPTLARQ